MSELPRLNGVIRALEAGGPAFLTFAAAEIGVAQAVGMEKYDGIVFEMEHGAYDIRLLRDCLQYLLNRAQIAASGSVAPAVTPMVRIPANGGEMNQWLAKQVLDSGVYGIIWPHVSTVDEARSAVAACRYTRPPGSPRFEPAGRRGDAPANAARYWGISNADYYARADVWPLDPQGEIMVAIMCESVRGIKNLPAILSQVPGIGAVIIGEGDLSQDLGVARQYDHPSLRSAMADVVAICREHNVPCGHPHVGSDNVERVLQEGFRWIMARPTASYAALQLGRRLAGRS